MMLNMKNCRTQLQVIYHPHNCRDEYLTRCCRCSLAMPTVGETFSFYKSLPKSLCSLAFTRLYRPQRIPARDLTGQTAIATGGNSGIGLSIAVALARQGAAVYLACRDSLIPEQQRSTMLLLSAMERAKQG
jgi:hypothetical protein